MKYYVTHYVEYPIYEPAEGGYYYAGRDINDSECFNSKAEAIAYLTERMKDEPREWEKLSDECYCLYSKYIGAEESMVIEDEKHFGEQRQGKVPYC